MKCFDQWVCRQCLLLCLSAGCFPRSKKHLGEELPINQLQKQLQKMLKVWHVTKLHQYIIKQNKHITETLLGAGTSIFSFLCHFLENKCCVAAPFYSPEQHFLKFICSVFIVYYIVAASHVLIKVTNHLILSRTEGCPRMQVFKF